MNYRVREESFQWGTAFYPECWSEEYQEWTVTTGVGYLIALVFILHSWWYIVFGTLLGMVAVFLQLLCLHDKKEKKE